MTALRVDLTTAVPISAALVNLLEASLGPALVKALEGVLEASGQLPPASATGALLSKEDKKKGKRMRKEAVASGLPPAGSVGLSAVGSKIAATHPVDIAKLVLLLKSYAGVIRYGATCC